MRHASLLSFIAGCVFTVAALTRCVVPAAKADGPDAGAQSTGRIKSNVLKTTDGTTISTGVLHDTKLNIDCRFQLAADGQLRCLPFGTYWTVIDDINQDYADDQCTIPLASTPRIAAGECGTPKYVVKRSAGEPRCGARFHVYEIGVQLERTYFGGPGHCQQEAGPVPGTDNFATGTEVPPETFALGTIE